MSFVEKLRAVQQKNQSWLCVGLDPVPEQLPPAHVSRHDEPLLPFNKQIIDATSDLVCAYKPNLGFYLQWGAAGVIALERTIAYIPDHIPVLLDAKIGDIGHTQRAWGRGLFDEWQLDAVTVNPYVGEEAIRPLLQSRPDKAIFVLLRTSNPSGSDFQGTLGDEQSLAAAVLQRSQKWHLEGHLGYVVGATVPHELATAREVAPQATFLIPGVGAQQGNLAAAVRYGASRSAGPLISSSRRIIYASRGLDFAEAARAAAAELRDQINRLREEA